MNPWVYRPWAFILKHADLQRRTVYVVSLSVVSLSVVSLSFPQVPGQRDSWGHKGR